MSLVRLVRARPGVSIVAAAIVLYIFGAGLIFGGFGTGRTPGAFAYEYSTTITTSTTTSTSTSTSTTTTTTPTSTKPGKGCGDKNHLHDRRFECKVVIDDASAKEGKSGTVSTLVLTVSLSGSPASPVTVDYSTAPGTATAGVDYLPVSGRLGFPVGTSSRTISVTILCDSAPESSETFRVNLSNPSANAYVGDAQAIATITGGS